MDTLHIFLFIYGILNIFISILFAMIGSDLWQYESFKSALIYTKLWDSLDSADINTAGKIIVCMFIALMSIPAYLIWLCILLILIIIEFFVDAFCIIFKRRK